MPEQNRTLAPDDVFEEFRAIYDAVSRGDVETYLDSLHDDVELHQSAEIPGTSGTFRGKQGALKLEA